MLNDLLRQLNALYLFLNQQELAVASNYHSVSQDEIRWSGFDSSMISLARDVPASDYYSSCVRNGQFNFLLIDGGLIQIQYRLRGDDIAEHRLLFMHSPTCPSLSTAPEEYAELMYGDTPFSDQIESDSPLIVMRFDFNDDASRYQERAHPYSHLTIGNIKSCRIPVKAPLTPNRFCDFVLRNFYNEPFIAAGGDTFLQCEIPLVATVSDAESALVHLNW